MFVTIELRVLALAVVLGIVQLVLATRAKTDQRGTDWNLGPRDEVQPALKGKAGRWDRAFTNFVETFPFFAAAILMVQVSNRLTTWTALGAELYLVCRILYIPAYVFAVRYVRTILWSFSMIGLLMVLWPMVWPF